MIDEQLPPPRLGDRSLFPDLEAEVYLNHAGISPMSVAVQRAVQTGMQAYASKGAGAWVGFCEQRNRLRTKLASLIGGAPEDFGLVPSTSHGILSVALCFPWRRGERVVLFDGEFPTNVTAWQRAAEQHELEVEFLPLSDYHESAELGLQRLEQELRRGVRLVAVSAVQFQTGLRMPLEEMTELCHRHGAEICVDAIQAVGVVPIQVGKADYFVCGSHKWMMAPEGAGFVYVSPARVESLRPQVAGWMSHEDGAAFLFEGEGHLRYDRPIRKRADFVEIGAMNSLGFVAVEAALDLILEITVPRIFQHVSGILAALEKQTMRRGFSSARGRDPATHSGILSLKPPSGVPLVELWDHLRQRGVECATPDGWLRFSPHWPNGVGEVERVTQALDEFQATRGSRSP